eukprot:145567-Prymnesium_polylepis.1
MVVGMGWWGWDGGRAGGLGLGHRAPNGATARRASAARGPLTPRAPLRARSFADWAQARTACCANEACEAIVRDNGLQCA